MNTNNKPFPVYEWNYKKFTSQDHLQTAFQAGKINREIVQSNSYGSWYKFSTKEGKEITTFYKDDTFGFCSQAYGIRLPEEILNDLGVS